MRTQTLSQCPCCKAIRWIVVDRDYPITVAAIKLAWGEHLMECLNRQDLAYKLVYGLGAR